MSPNQRIIVRLVDIDGKIIRLSGVYLTVSFFVNGVYRFAFRSDSSNKDGLIIVSYESMEAGSLRNLKVQPLDYQTKLEDCDPFVEISIPKQEELVRAAEILESMGMGKHLDLAKGWRCAANDHVQSTTQKVVLRESSSQYNLVCTAIS